MCTELEQHAGSNRPLEDLILSQVGYLLALKGGAVSEEEKKKLAAIEADVAAVKALTAADKGSTKRLLGAMPTYWLDLQGYLPNELVKSVKKPMLFLQGGRDYQVQTVDLDNWRAALSGRSDVEFHLYPKLNHLFYAGEGILAPVEYERHGSVAVEVVTDIANWIGKH